MKIDDTDDKELTIRSVGGIAERAVLHILGDNAAVVRVVFACNPENVPSVRRFTHDNPGFGPWQPWQF